MTITSPRFSFLNFSTALQFQLSFLNDLQQLKVIFYGNRQFLNLAQFVNLVIIPLQVLPEQIDLSTPGITMQQPGINNRWIRNP